MFLTPVACVALAAASVAPTAAFSPGWHSHPLARHHAARHEQQHPLAAAIHAMQRHPSWFDDVWDAPLVPSSFWDWPLSDVGFHTSPAIRDASMAAQKLARSAAAELSHELKAAKVAQTDSRFTVTLDTAG